MILADKIVLLRKKNGWSQEELADKMNVSRQAVSKWEAAQSTPDLEKILQLSNLFGVTTDYLLKDEIEDEEFTDSVESTAIRKLSLSQANDYMKEREIASVKISVATLLCILSPIPLLILIALSDLQNPPIMQNMAVGVGICSILLLVAWAVSIFIRVGFRNAPYEFLDDEPFELEYGVTGLAKEREKSYRPTYVRYNIIGVITCLMSPAPVIVGGLFGNELVVMLTLCATILTVGIGVLFLVRAGVRWGSMQRLLKEGDFSPKNKTKERVESAYWLAVTAIYLAWSFITGDWHISWVIWPVAGILSGVIDLIHNTIVKDNDKN